MLSRSLTNVATKSATFSPSAQSSFGEVYSHISQMSKSNDWAERLQAVTSLKELLRSAKTPTSREVNRVCGWFARQVRYPVLHPRRSPCPCRSPTLPRFQSARTHLQFNEAHNKVLMAVIDTMCDFIVIYKDEIPPNWLRDVIPGLLTKFGAGLVPKTQEKILYALELVRNSFPVETQLTNLIKLVLDPLHNHNTKVKLAVMEFTALVLPLATPNDFDATVAASPSEFRGALQKMLEFSNGGFCSTGRRAGGVGRRGAHTTFSAFSPQLRAQSPRAWSSGACQRTSWWPSLDSTLPRSTN